MSTTMSTNINNNSIEDDEVQDDYCHDGNMVEDILDPSDPNAIANPGPVEALTKLCQRTLYPLTQENGQRCYGPPPGWHGPIPERGCEVFVGKIPRDCYEDELVPIFEEIGPIYMFRLMLDFTGNNRGYGFCLFTTREHAKEAVHRIDNYEIRTDKKLGVCQSVDNCRLFVGGIPKNKVKEEILKEMEKVTEGVRDVIVYPSAADKKKNRGFAFVEYESHKAAAMARRKLMPGRIPLWGQQIAVDWAEPEREVDENIMASVKILYVRNLMLTTTEEVLKDVFIRACEAPDGIERVKKMRDYAFVHFRDRKLARLAMERMHNADIEGSRVEVSWAKPVDKSEASGRSTSKSSVVSKTNNNAVPTNAPTAVTNNAAMFQMPLYFDPFYGTNIMTATAAAAAAANATVASPGITGLNVTSPTGIQRANGPRGVRVYRNAAGSRSAGSRSSIPGYHRDKRSSETSGLLQQSVNYVEMLQGLCHKYNWGTPAYSISAQDIMDPTTGQKTSIHLGQVSIAGLNQQYIAPMLSFSSEEAKQTAAKSVLTLFSMQFDANYQAAAMSLLQPLDPTTASLFYDMSAGLLPVTGPPTNASNILNVQPLMHTADLFAVGTNAGPLFQ